MNKIISSVSERKLITIFNLTSFEYLKRKMRRSIEVFIDESLQSIANFSLLSLSLIQIRQITFTDILCREKKNKILQSKTRQLFNYGFRRSTDAVGGGGTPRLFSSII
jgi:hypothetical protein